MTRANRSAASSTAMLWLLLAPSAIGCADRQLNHIRAHRVAADLPRTDPLAAAWDSAPAYEATLLQQNMIAPTQSRQSVDKVTVRGLHDGRWVAFRLDWADTTDNHNVATTTFSDAAAMQFPAVRALEPPSDMMGNVDRPVDIVYFRAAWQTENNEAELYPNTPPLFHPAEAAAEGDARAGMERAYAPAAHTANPTVNRPDGASVVAFSAGGFGSLSPSETALAVDGRGAYHEGRWYVVIARELGDQETSPLAVGRRSTAAIAIWDGANGDVGPRKNRSTWIDVWIDGEAL